jgi:hypothetical protein
VWLTLVWLEKFLGDIVQPLGPGLQAVLMLQCTLEVELKVVNDALVTLAHPRRLLLHVGEVDLVKVSQHLLNLLRVLQDSASGLSKVVE